MFIFRNVPIKKVQLKLRSMSFIGRAKEFTESLCLIVKHASFLLKDAGEFF